MRKIMSLIPLHLRQGNFVGLRIGLALFYGLKPARSLRDQQPTVIHQPNERNFLNLFKFFLVYSKIFGSLVNFPNPILFESGKNFSEFFESGKNDLGQDISARYFLESGQNFVGGARILDPTRFSGVWSYFSTLNQIFFLSMVSFLGVWPD